MEPFLSDTLQAWRLETRREASGDWCHQSVLGPERWRPLRHLGNGTFGDVWLEHCVDGPSCNTLRAVKHIRKRHADFSKPSRRELEALITFSDPRVPEYQHHFVRCLGWFDDVEHLYVAMEFIQGGDLQQYIGRRPFPEPEAASITAQAAQALQYMHRNSFVHRDVKPLNLLVSRLGPDWHVKLADFGLAKNTDDTALRTHNVGTQRYMAPELFDDGPGQYTPAVDVWALGAVAFCMRSGTPPFRSSKHLFDYVHGKTHFPMRELETSSGFYLGFVMGAMEVAPERRMTIEQVLEHDWLSMHSRDIEAPGPGATSTMGSSPWAMATPNSWLSTHDNNAVIQQPQPPPPVTFDSRPQLAFGGAPAPQSSQARSWGGTPAREEPLRQYLQETGSEPLPGNWAPNEPSLPPGRATMPASRFHGLPRVPMTASGVPGWESPVFGTWASRHNPARAAPPGVEPAGPPYSSMHTPEVATTVYPGQTLDSFQQATVVPPSSAGPPVQHPSPIYGGTAPPTAANVPIQPGPVKAVLEGTTQSRAAAQADPSVHKSWAEEYDEKTRQHAAYMESTQLSRAAIQEGWGYQTGHHMPELARRLGTSHSGSADTALIKDTSSHDRKQRDTPNAETGPETDPFLTCLTCRTSYKSRRYLMDHTAVRGHAPQIDSYLTCLACQLSFGERSDLFEHLERSGHARDTFTNQPEAYTRPERSRLRDLGEWGGEEGQKEDERWGGQEEYELPDPRFTCLTCSETFPNRSDLFEHLERAGHARDTLTNKTVTYTRPEWSRLRDLGEWLDPRSTCLTCHKTFPNRSDMFEHLERAGHARDTLTNKPVTYTRPEGSRLKDLGEWIDEE